MLGIVYQSQPKAGPPSHILLQKDGQMVDGKVGNSFIPKNCLQVRGLLEQAEEMVESEDLMEEEFNQVMFGFFRNMRKR